MQEMVKDTVATSANLLKSANEFESENKKLKRQVKFEQDKYARDVEKIMTEERQAREKLRKQIESDQA